MKLLTSGKWYVLWELGANARLGIELNFNSWKLGVDAYPAKQLTPFNPLCTRAMLEVQVGPFVAWVSR